jgi:hypothetical protein
MLKQAENLGFYLPAFFFIKVNTNESLIEIENCSKHTKATYFHEYVHFLQDLFTLFGLRNINYIVNVVYSINKESLKLDEIIYPLTITDEEILTQKEIFNFYYGTTILSYDPFLVTGYNITPNNCVPGFEYIECVEIETISLGIGNDSFYFGAFSILESLAHIIEKSIFGISSSLNFPYNIVDLILDSLFPDLNLSPELRLALCEESLNSGHPGRTFFTILERVKANKLKFKTPEEFHTYCHLQFFLQDENRVKFSISFALDSETNKSQSNLKTYFRDEKIIRINSWIDFIFNKLKGLRKQGFHFFKLFNNKDYFVSIMNELGTPLVADNNNYYFQNPKIDQSECDISIFLAIRELMMISLGEQNHCELKSRCLLVNEELVNNNCDTAPHENRKNEKKCDLAALMYFWGLK